jgi:hypothetical protein
VRVAFAVVVLASAHTAIAAPRVEVVGDACDAGELAARVVALSDSSTNASARVAIARNSDAIAGRVTLDGHERIVDGPTCDDVLDKLALVIAMSLGDTLVSSPPARVSNAERRDRGLALIGGAGFGVTSTSTTGEVVLGARLRRGNHSIDLEVSSGPPDHLAILAMGGVDVWTAQLTASPCMHRAALAACGLASVGIAAGTPHALFGEQSAIAPLVSAGARLAWEQPVTALAAVRVRADVMGELVGTQFDVDHVAAWVSPHFGALLGIDVLARFP